MSGDGDGLVWAERGALVADVEVGIGPRVDQTTWFGGDLDGANVALSRNQIHAADAGCAEGDGDGGADGRPTNSETGS